MWVLDSPFNHIEGRLKQIQMDQIELDEVHGVEIQLVRGGGGWWIHQIPRLLSNFPPKKLRELKTQ